MSNKQQAILLTFHISAIQTDSFSNKRRERIGQINTTSLVHRQRFVRLQTVEKPAECVKFWLYKGDPEYFTGDVWTDTDKLVAEQLYGVEVHTESFAKKSYPYFYSASRFYLAWLDDKGNYHAIYEYDPHK